MHRASSFYDLRLLRSYEEMLEEDEREDKNKGEEEHEVD